MYIYTDTDSLLYLGIKPTPFCLLGHYATILFDSYQTGLCIPDPSSCHFCVKLLHFHHFMSNNTTSGQAGHLQCDA